MFDIFGSLRGVIKLESVCIDNFVFRLHYKATVLFLISCSILVASRHYFGDPIDCIQTSNIPGNIFDTYCWIHPTFTIPDAYGKKVTEGKVPHPGIDKYEPGDKRIHHAYYQWVSFMLFIQAVLFYAPRYMWKVWEGGKIKTITLSLRSPILKPEDKEEEKALLVNYLSKNLRYHTGYLARFTVCEILNFVNVVGQMFLMNKFLGNTFTTFGIEVLSFLNADDEDRVDPMVFVFPRMTKCTLQTYGDSGTIKKHDGLCILPLNIINEKIYIFLWFWFVLVMTFSSIMIVYRFAVIMSRDVRYLLMKRSAELTSESVIRAITTRCGAGGWFLLSQLCKNIDPVHFKDVMEDLADEMRNDSNGVDTMKLVDRKDKDTV